MPLQTNYHDLEKAYEAKDKIKVVPHPKLKRDYKDKRIRTKRKLSNHYFEIEAGALGTITNQSNKGSYITFDACECCKASPHISGVDMHSIEFIEG